MVSLLYPGFVVEVSSLLDIVAWSILTLRFRLWCLIGIPLILLIQPLLIDAYIPFTDYVFSLFPILVDVDKGANSRFEFLIHCFKKLMKDLFFSKNG